MKLTLDFFHMNPEYKQKIVNVFYDELTWIHDTIKKDLCNWTDPESETYQKMLSWQNAAGEQAASLVEQLKKNDIMISIDFTKLPNTHKVESHVYECIRDLRISISHDIVYINSLRIGNDPEILQQTLRLQKQLIAFDIIRKTMSETLRDRKIL
jgi:hypothetical protein